MGVFQSDARTAAILGGLGIVGVIGSEDKRIVLLGQTDVDGSWGVTVHAVLESIFDEGDEQ